MQPTEDEHAENEGPVELSVPPRFAGLRLTRFLERHFPRLGRTTAFKLIRLGKVQVNGQPVEEDRALEAGEWITVVLRESKTDPLGISIPLEILHEDPNLLVINKPAGEGVVHERGERRCRLLTAVAEHFRESGADDAEPRVVHRLDRDTSGVLIIAKNRETQKWITQQFMENSVEKRYLALVEGEIYEDTGSVDLKIRPASRRSTRMRTSETVGRDALTDYRIIELFRGYTLLEALPRTGRTHQIRVHLSAIGHPLAIDTMYGTSQEMYLSDLKRNYRRPKDRPEPPIMDRLTLHAESIRFRPTPDEEPTQIEAPVPDDLSHLLRCLRRHRKASRGGPEEAQETVEAGN